MKVSFIVPIYNSEKYLSQCIDSILAQKHYDFELLLIDDGSRDNSGKICDNYAKNDIRIRVFHKENGGVSSARNIGLDNSKGDWIIFVDSDDWIGQDYLLPIKEVDNNIDIDIIYFGTITLNYKNKEIINYSPVLGVINGIDTFTYNLGRGICNHFIRKSIIHKNHVKFNENIHIHEDLEFNMKCIIVSNVFCISYNRYYYRYNPNSVSKSKIPYYKVLNILDVAKNIYQYLDGLNYNFNERNPLNNYLIPFRDYLFNIIELDIPNSIIKSDLRQFMSNVEKVNLNFWKKLVINLFLINPRLFIAGLYSLKRIRTIFREIN